ncbi:MAG: FHA domain-containing protein [Vicinamibacterales bacterium]
MARLIETIAKLEKTIDGFASRRGVMREPVEIQREILDAVESHVQVVGRSRRALAFNRITVHLLAGDPERRAALQAVFGAEQLAQSIQDRLREIGAEAAPGLEVAVKFVKSRPSGGNEGRFYWVRFERVHSRREPDGAGAAPSPAAARLVVVKGRAARKSFDIGAGLTNIGRLAEVTDTAARVVRRNQVVFLDGDDDLTRTVSRAHAHIVFTPPSDYRLHDDRSSHGTRVFRQGRTLEIASGSPRGLKLRPGDEIYFGHACVRFEAAQPGSSKTEARKVDTAPTRPARDRIEPGRRAGLRHKDKR